MQYATELSILVSHHIEHYMFPPWLAVIQTMQTSYIGETRSKQDFLIIPVYLQYVQVHSVNWLKKQTRNDKMISNYTIVIPRNQLCITCKIYVNSHRHKTTHPITFHYMYVSIRYIYIYIFTITFPYYIYKYGNVIVKPACIKRIYVYAGMKHFFEICRNMLVAFV
jgi:hypothetical protein